MGWPSYLEDIEQQAIDNRMRLETYEAQFAPAPVIVAVSPPLQPPLPSLTVPARPDAATVAARIHAQHEKHTLALLELLPGTRWRH